MMSSLAWLVDLYAKNRFPGSRIGRRAAERYIRAYDNNDVDMRRNGEFWLIGTLAKIRGCTDIVAFDVGANEGEWSERILQVFPNAQVHAFEPAPATYERLKERVSGINFVTNNVGLSDTESDTILYYASANSHYASIIDHKNMNSRLHKVAIDVKLTKGDIYCNKNMIEHIDVLKIDVEGNDLNVLKGFQSMLDNNSIDTIQFEYNYTTLFARVALFDYYDLLSKNYYIGRLLPKGVELLKYSSARDDFRQANFVALSKHSLSDDKLYDLCMNFDTYRM